MNADPVSPEATDDGQPVRLLPTVNALLRRRWTVAAWTTVFALGAVASVLPMDETWTSTAKFLPSKPAGVATRMGALAGTTGSPSESDDAGSADYYVALLQSLSFLERVVVREFAATGTPPRTLAAHDGFDALGESVGLQRAAAALQQRISVTAARASAPGAPRVVTLQVTAESPQLAAEVAGALLAQIDEHNATARESRAKRNREFVEERVKKAREEVNDAADQLAKFEAQNRRADAPRLRAEQDRLTRQVRVLEEVFVTLTKQLELAKIEEEESRPSIEVIQRPEPPLTRTSPRRTQTVVIWTTIGFFLGCMWALLSERFRRADPGDPEQREFIGHVQDMGRLIGVRPSNVGAGSTSER